MIELGVSRVPRATEVRSGENSYTDLVLAGLLAQQGRGAAAAEWATGAVQSAAGLWARCLSVATSEHEAVNPDVLGAIAWDLGIVGEHVSILQVDGSGRVALLRASSWNISGGPSPSSWLYDVSLSGPTGTHTRRVTADGVLHVRYLPDNRTPWRGVAPWKRTPTLSKLAAEVEAALVREVRLPTKISYPDAARREHRHEHAPVRFSEPRISDCLSDHDERRVRRWKIVGSIDRLEGHALEVRARRRACRSVPRYHRANRRAVWDTERAHVRVRVRNSDS